MCCRRPVEAAGLLTCPTVTVHPGHPLPGPRHRAGGGYPIWQGTVRSWRMPLPKARPRCVTPLAAARPRCIPPLAGAQTAAHALDRGLPRSIPRLPQRPSLSLECGLSFSCVSWTLPVVSWRSVRAKCIG